MIDTQAQTLYGKYGDRVDRSSDSLIDTNFSSGDRAERLIKNREIFDSLNLIDDENLSQLLGKLIKKEKLDFDDIQNLRNENQFFEHIYFDVHDSNAWKKDLLEKLLLKPDLKESFKLLVDNFVTYASDVEKNNLLHLATSLRNFNALNIILDNGSFNPNQVDYRGLAPIHKSSQKDNNTLSLRALINHNADVNILNSKFESPLMLAVKRDRQDNFQELMNQKVDLDTIDNYGNTPLLKALEKENSQMAEALIEKGANLNAVNNLGRNSIILASKFGHTDILEKLLENGSDFDKQDLLGNTALHYAVKNADANSVKLLLDAEVDPNKVNIFGEKALDIAKKNDLENITKLFRISNIRTSVSKKAFKPDLNYQDSEFAMRTVLHDLVRLGEDPFQEVKELVEAGAKPELRDKLGLNVFDYANLAKQPKVKDYLFHLNSDLSLKSNLPYNGILSQATGVGGVDQIKRVFSFFKLHPDYKEDVNTGVNDEAYLPLHIAALNKDVRATNLLLDNEANLEAKDSSGNTALFYALKSKDLKVLKFLLLQGADINHRNNLGQTLLHIAAGDKSLVKSLDYLIKTKKIDLSHKDTNNDTALEIAASKSSLESVELLLNNTDKKNLSLEDSAKLLNKSLSNKDVRVFKYLLKQLKPLSMITEFDSNTLLNRLRYSNADKRKDLIETLKNDDFKLSEQELFTIYSSLETSRSSDDIKSVLETRLIDDLARDTNSVKLHKYQGLGLNFNKELVNGQKLLLALVKDSPKELIQDILNSDLDLSVKGLGNLNILHVALANPVLANDLELLSSLIERSKEQINEVDSKGTSVLHHAAYRNNFNAVKLLIDNAADLNIKDQDGHTVTHVMAAKGDLALYELLENKQVDFKERSNKKQSLLHLAAFNHKHPEVLEKLLATNRIDLNLKDSAGKTFVDYALMSSNPTIKNIGEKYRG